MTSVLFHSRKGYICLIIIGNAIFKVNQNTGDIAPCYKEITLGFSPNSSISPFNSSSVSLR
ncbi:MAG TPA: hypothetical protein PKX08_12530, partial [Cyclobacteriaceae bacterium]|nr:hypothetical protein [Cyclobacteriaceae bacterium]